MFRRRVDGLHIINIEKTWEKIQLAARVIVTIENPADVIAVSSRPYAQRAVLKYAHYTGAQHNAGRYTPGTFTNQITKQVRTLFPWVVVVSPANPLSLSFSLHPRHTLLTLYLPSPPYPPPHTVQGAPPLDCG